MSDEVLFTQEFWDERYRTAGQLWSGEPNPRLVDVAAELTPGTALDVGCGEGADAIWLAAQGWRVTAVDVSQVALDRAEEAGAKYDDRISWEQEDVLSWDPAPLRFDLVTAHFMHLPETERDALHRRLAAAVQPGGTLLIVGHHPADRPDHLPELRFTAEDVAAVLDPADWRIVTSSVSRETTDPDGHTVTASDTVLRATRH